MSEKSIEERLDDLARHVSDWRFGEFLDQASDEIRRLRESLATSNRMHVAAERQLTEETAEVGRLREEMKSVQSRLATISKRMESVEDRAFALQEDRSELETKLAAETARRESAEAMLRRVNDPDNYTTDVEIAEYFARYATTPAPDRNTGSK